MDINPMVEAMGMTMIISRPVVLDSDYFPRLVKLSTHTIESFDTSDHLHRVNQVQALKRTIFDFKVVLLAA